MMMKWARYSNKAVSDSGGKEWKNMTIFHSNEKQLITVAIPAVNNCTMHIIIRQHANFN